MLQSSLPQSLTEDGCTECITEEEEKLGRKQHGECQNEAYAFLDRKKKLSLEIQSFCCQLNKGAVPTS